MPAESRTRTAASECETPTRVWPAEAVAADADPAANTPTATARMAARRTVAQRVRETLGVAMVPAGPPVTEATRWRISPCLDGREQVANSGANVFNKVVVHRNEGH
jgi:hypothetical protein